MVKIRRRRKKLTFEERKKLEQYLTEGKILKIKIAEILKISPSTISSEIKRCCGEYNAAEAQKDCEDKIKAQIDALVNTTRDAEIKLHGHRMPSRYIAIKTDGYYYMHDTKRRRNTFLGIALDKNDVPDFFEII